MSFPPRLGRFLFVIWQSGGGTQPELGLARLTAARGHVVHVLAPEIHRARVEAAGCEWVAMPPECEFDPSKGRALEDQWEEFGKPTLWGMRIPQALLGAAETHLPDVVVIDQQLRSTLSAAERIGVKQVTFAHTAYRFHGIFRPDWAEEDAAMTNEARARLGLESISLHGRPVSIELMDRADSVLVAMTPEFDPWEEPLDNVVHVGPLFEEDVSELAWESPWPSDEGEPLVVVSLSSMYMHQENLLARIFRALDGLSTRVLLLTGTEFDAREVDVPSQVVAREYVPHLVVLPHADLVITHGGMGTIMAAFACAVPLVCIPLGRDQDGNCARVEELGAGLGLPQDADAATIRDATVRTLESSDIRDAAARMADVVASYGDGVRAVAELEGLL